MWPRRSWCRARIILYPEHTTTTYCTILLQYDDGFCLLAYPGILRVSSGHTFIIISGGCGRDSLTQAQCALTTLAMLVPSFSFRYGGLLGAALRHVAQEPKQGRTIAPQPRMPARTSPAPWRSGYLETLKLRARTGFLQRTARYSACLLSPSHARIRPARAVDSQCSVASLLSLSVSVESPGTRPLLMCKRQRTCLIGL